MKQKHILFSRSGNLYCASTDMEQKKVRLTSWYIQIHALNTYAPFQNTTTATGTLTPIQCNCHDTITCGILTQPCSALTAPRL